MLQPHLDYSLGYCLHECNLCTQVCPDGALKPLSLGEKQSHAVGKAKFVLKNCVTQTDGSECGLCSRKCPVGAIDMVEHGDTLIPQVNEAICVGCGKCEYACPATPESRRRG
jgi:ferredoxin